MKRLRFTRAKQLDQLAHIPFTPFHVQVYRVVCLRIRFASSSSCMLAFSCLHCSSLLRTLQKQTPILGISSPRQDIPRRHLEATHIPLFKRVSQMLSSSPEFGDPMHLPSRELRPVVVDLLVSAISRRILGLLSPFPPPSIQSSPGYLHQAGPSRAKQGRTRCGHGQASQKSTSDRAVARGHGRFPTINLNSMIHCHDGESFLLLCICSCFFDLPWIKRHKCLGRFLGAVLGTSWLCKLSAWRRDSGFLECESGPLDAPS